RIKELALQISKDYFNKNLLLLGILRGAIIFLSDLSKQLKFPLIIDLMLLSRSTCNNNYKGEIKILKDLDRSIENYEILIVKDIINKGNTLNYLLDNLKLRHPKSIKICTLIDKPSLRQTNIKPDYNVFTVPNYFLVGYGLDYKQKYRYLPFLATLKKEILQYGGN
ncbi:MAG: hypoxanthine phosphoribosyltransferase, partial [Armatimonadetes bacterium]|nr:hypoxanthine phosphoribosyltransferase [Armatimonadota bacterium]